MPNIGPLELVIVLVIILVIFGPKRLPGLGKQLGSGMRDFKDAIAGKDDDDDDDTPTGRPALTQAAEPAAPVTPPPSPAAAAEPVATPTPEAASEAFGRDD